MAPDDRMKYRIKNELAKLELDQRQLDLQKERLALDRRKLDLEQKLIGAAEDEASIVDLTMDEDAVEVKEERTDNTREGICASHDGRALEGNPPAPSHGIKQEDDRSEVRSHNANQMLEETSVQGGKNKTVPFHNGGLVTDPDIALTPARAAVPEVTRLPASQQIHSEQFQTPRTHIRPPHHRQTPQKCLYSCATLSQATKWAQDLLRGKPHPWKTEIATLCE
ncbi:hypothetical protein H2200_011540 [Cladophialophora chaetospira]|uniref:Uncharacterized protein n=1 Tax=Cladophialophora chaetospira TaxID=386627 RepID=A0AA38WZL0_9EURO|nr:hypothetical protein H2200_011540 [Cladophialophora chaetospira]